MKFELNTLGDYSDDSLLSEMRRVAKTLAGERMTIEKFDAVGRVHSTTIRARFGSWRAALDRAGIDESIAPRPKTLLREHIVAAIRAFAAEYPGQPVAQEAILFFLWLHEGA